MCIDPEALPQLLRGNPFQTSSEHQIAPAASFSASNAERGMAALPPPKPPVSVAGRRGRSSSLGSLREWQATPKLPSRVSQPFYQPGRRATLITVDGSPPSSGDSGKWSNRISDTSQMPLNESKPRTVAAIDRSNAFSTSSAWVYVQETLV